MKRTLLFRWITTAVAGFMFLFFSSPQVAYGMEPRTSANLRGIDVSHWDGVIDWKRVSASHVRFAYIKASGGNSFIDPEFATNVKNARRYGIAVGAYHYAQPTSPFNPKQPAEQAAFFVNTMKHSMSGFGDIMPVLDVEVSGSLSTPNLVRWVRIFVDTVEHETNRQVMLYTSEYFMQQHANFNDQIADLPLWVAYYDRYYGGQKPPDIGGWSRWNVWQYSDRGVVSGISGTVDLNGGPTSLAALMGELPSVAHEPTDNAVKPTNKVLQHGAPQAGRNKAASVRSPVEVSLWSTSRFIIVLIAVGIVLTGLVISVFWASRRRKTKETRFVHS
jgi:GH25 family lysozyme M1 (1,4-beta-N-acetylmuramidase)